MRGFLPIDATTAVDTQTDDAAPDGGDLDAPTRDVRDATADRRGDVVEGDAPDLDGDVARDGARDAPRDIAVESNISGCMTNADCPSALQYCNAGGCDARGFCAFRTDPMSCPSPDASTAQIVCGCDGVTYPSLCMLQAEGVRLRAVGMCPRP